MRILKEEGAQTSAEMILIFGGMIVIAIAAATYYRIYLAGLGNEITNTDLNAVTQKLSELNEKLKNL